MENPDIINVLRNGLQAILAMREQVENGEMDELSALDDAFSHALNSLYEASQLGLQ